jgi:protein-L-isoaspartate(D-aspartate) O-methyltransferase
MIGCKHSTSINKGMMMSFEQARYNMVVQQIRPWYVWDERVLEAMQKIPRENFVPQDYGRLAYSDMSIPITHDESMLPPKLVARALDQLKLKAKNKVLEIGTGTGYITAILLELCQEVISVEIDEELHINAKTNLDRTLHKGLSLELGDAVQGWPTKGPFDAIFVSGAYPLGVPEKVCQQLKDGGRLFAICGDGVDQHAVLIERNNNIFTTNTLFETEAPILKNAHHKSSFEF